MFEDLDTLFDGCTLSVSDWTFMFMHKEVTRGANRGEDKIWYGTVDFRIRLEKIRT